MGKENAMKESLKSRQRENTFYLDHTTEIADKTRGDEEEIGFFESIDDGPLSMPLLLSCPECGTDNIHVEVTEDYVLIITCRECGCRKRYQD